PGLEVDTLRLAPAVGVGDVIGVVALEQEGAQIKAVPALHPGGGAQEVPGVANLVQFRGPDELAESSVLTLVPDHILLGVGQALDGVRHTDDQAVIAVRPVLAVDGIGGGEVVQVPLLVVGDAGVCPLLNEGVLGVGVVSTATDGAPDGVLHAGTAGVHLVQVGGVPAHIVGALFPVGVLGDQLTHSLIQSLLGIAVLLHGHLLGHRGDGGVVGVGVLGGELVI